MNHHAVKTILETPHLPLLPDAAEGLTTIPARLRQLAAQFNMHHALIHRLGPPDMRVADATYSSIIRNIGASSWSLGQLTGSTTLERLIAGNCAVVWRRDSPHAVSRFDPLDRLDIRCGVSVPFHNALGNHAALTLCDSEMPATDLTVLTHLALPLMDVVLSAERAKNAALVLLSTRETHCLQWAAAGKTSLETGMILGLSPHTVNQYLTSATIKLKAVNRTHAVTKAVRLGLINLTAV
jgi:DNA-binding CsgD family transcriptional regulator